jgi:3-methyladenine DNA glycosylase/8-oxoguanine DNA glycosylase
MKYAFPTALLGAGAVCAAIFSAILQARESIEAIVGSQNSLSELLGTNEGNLVMLAHRQLNQ